MSPKNISYVRQHFKCDGKTKLCEILKDEFGIQGQILFIYDQIIHSILKSGKDAHMAKSEDIKNLVFQSHHLINNQQIYRLNKLNSKKIYSILIQSDDSKPSFQLYYKSIFRNSYLDWKTIYMLPRIATKHWKHWVF